MTKMYSFRIDDETIRKIDELAQEFGLTRTDIIKIAIRLLNGNLKVKEVNKIEK